MQVRFESRAREGVHIRQAATRRAHFVMRRLCWLVPGMRIVLSEINGARGGIDKCCQVEMRTFTGTQVVASGLASDWRAALDLALARAARALLRSWRRMNHRQRPVLRALHGQ